MFSKFGSYGIVLLLLLMSCGKELEDSKKSEAKDDPSSRSSNVSNQAEQELYRAIESNDDTIVETALSNHPEVDYQFVDGETPLTMAIKKARTEIIIKILNKTKKVDLRNNEGKSPLIVSLQKGNLFVTRLIINKGADLNLADNNGMTPLYYAIYGIKEDLALNLVKAGADLTIRPKGEPAPLNLAIENGLDELARLIPLVLEHSGPSNRTLNNAIKSANHHFVEYLLNNFVEYKEIIQKRNVLITAINIDDSNGRLLMMRTLLNRGANPNNSEGDLPLIHATDKQYSDVVDLLLLYADPFQTDFDGLTALHAAVYQNNYTITLRIYRNMVNKATNREGVNLDLIVRSACQNRPRSRDLNNMRDGYSQYRYITNLLRCY